MATEKQKRAFGKQFQTKAGPADLRPGPSTQSRRFVRMMKRSQRKSARYDSSSSIIEKENPETKKNKE